MFVYRFIWCANRHVVRAAVREYASRRVFEFRGGLENEEEEEEAEREEEERREERRKWRRKRRGRRRRRRMKCNHLDAGEEQDEEKSRGEREEKGYSARGVREERLRDRPGLFSPVKIKILLAILFRHGRVCPPLVTDAVRLGRLLRERHRAVVPMCKVRICSPPQPHPLRPPEEDVGRAAMRGEGKLGGGRRRGYC